MATKLLSAFLFFVFLSSAARAENDLECSDGEMTMFAKQIAFRIADTLPVASCLADRHVDTNAIDLELAQYVMTNIPRMATSPTTDDLSYKVDNCIGGAASIVGYFLSLLGTKYTNFGLLMTKSYASSNVYASKVKACVARIKGNVDQFKQYEMPFPY